ncbi:MAG: GGDEF domain-containing protein [Geminicoccaceae bacterium]
MTCEHRQPEHSEPARSARDEAIREVADALATAGIGLARLAGPNGSAIANSAFRQLLDNPELEQPGARAEMPSPPDATLATGDDGDHVEEIGLSDGRHVLAIETRMTDGSGLALRLDITRLKRLAHVFQSFSDIVASRQIEPEVKIRRILNLGCEQLGLPWGALFEDRNGTMALNMCHPPNARPPIDPILLDVLSELDGPTLLDSPGDEENQERLAARTLLAPVLVDEERFGFVVFSGESWRDSPDDAGDIDILEVFCQWIGHELAREQDLAELALAHRELERLANTDELTGIANRRYFMSHSKKILREAGAGTGPSSIGILDIDHFKRVNDAHGHDTGDELLRAFAQAIAEGLGPDGLVGRLGGEEFAILLPSSNLREARAIADHVRRKVAEIHITCPGTGDRIGCTTSIGIAEFATDERLLRDAMTRADAALYAAKRDGRNRVRASDRPASGGERVNEQLTEQV